jgi:hypothetical protein
VDLRYRGTGAAMLFHRGSKARRWLLPSAGRYDLASEGDAACLIIDQDDLV